MSHSHKDRHQWKKKERRRTGLRDPKKIQLHRERFLQRVKEHSLRLYGYSALVFQARISLDPDTYETMVRIDGETLGTLPYLLEDVTSCHFLLAQHEPRFDVGQEAEYLKRHASTMRRLGLPCHLEVRTDTGRQCSSVIPCRFRKWNPATCNADCTK